MVVGLRRYDREAKSAPSHMPIKINRLSALLLCRAYLGRL